MTDEQQREHADQTLAATPDEEATPAKQPLSEEEIAARHAAWWQERKERAEDLTLSSRRSWAAMQGWDAVTSQEEWDKIANQTVEDWHSGALLMTMLGGERYLDPQRTALLYHLWHHFVGAYRPAGPAEYLAIAMALFAFHHLVRVNEFVGNLAARAENTFFSTEPLEVRIVKDNTAVGFYDRIEAKAQGHEYLAQLGRDALPLMDRLNRMVIRNLKALRDLKAAPTALNVQNYGQLNVGQMQTNVTKPTNIPSQPTPEPAANTLKHRCRKNPRKGPTQQAR